MQKFWQLVLFFLSVCSVGIYAQSSEAVGSTTVPSVPPEAIESDDSLFGEGAKDTVADPTEKVDLGKISTTEQPVFRGGYSNTGALALGWSEWPQLSDLGIGFKGAFGYTLGVKINFDLRPDPSIRFSGTVGASFPSTTTSQSLYPGIATVPSFETENQTEATFNWSAVSFSFEELFFDYTFAQSIFLRVGKYAITWGQGRLFNPGNFLSNSSKGVSLKIFVPIFTNGLTAVVLANPDYFAFDEDPSWTEIAIAGLLEESIGPLVFGISGFFQKDLKPLADVYLRTSIAGIDIYAEAVASFVRDQIPSWKFLAGFFWEGLTPKLRLVGEYHYDYDSAIPNDHRVSAAVTLDTIPGLGIRPSLLWYQSLTDGSGQVATGFSFSLGPHLDATIGLGITYGNEGTTYAKTGDSSLRRVVFIVKVDLAGDF